MTVTTKGREVQSMDLIGRRGRLLAHIRAMQDSLAKVHDGITEACTTRLDAGESVADLLRALSEVTGALLVSQDAFRAVEPLEETAWELGRRAGREDIRARRPGGGRHLSHEAVPGD